MYEIDRMGIFLTSREFLDKEDLSKIRKKAEEIGYESHGIRDVKLPLEAGLDATMSFSNLSLYTENFDSECFEDYLDVLWDKTKQVAADLELDPEDYKSSVCLSLFTNDPEKVYEKHFEDMEKFSQKLFERYSINLISTEDNMLLVKIKPEPEKLPLGQEN